jgi:hypothetical protein
VIHDIAARSSAAAHFALAILGEIAMGASRRRWFLAGVRFPAAPPTPNGLKLRHHAPVPSRVGGEGFMPKTQNPPQVIAALKAKIAAIPGLAAAYRTLPLMSEKELRLVLARHRRYGLPNGVPAHPHPLIGKYADEWWDFDLDDFPAGYINHLREDGETEDEVLDELSEQDMWPSAAPEHVADLDVYGFVMLNGVQLCSCIIGLVDDSEKVWTFADGRMELDGGPIDERLRWCAANLANWTITVDHQPGHENYVVSVGFSSRADRAAYQAVFNDNF